MAEKLHGTHFKGNAHINTLTRCKSILSVHLHLHRLPPVPPAFSKLAHHLCLRLQAAPFSSSAAEKVPIPQFKGPTGPASMIDSLEMRTRV